MSAFFIGGITNEYNTNEVFGGEHWKLIVDITIEGKRKHKEITGYSTYPDGFTFFETFLNDYDNKSLIKPVHQSIADPNDLSLTQEHQSFWKKLIKFINKWQ